MVWLRTPSTYPCTSIGAEVSGSIAQPLTHTVGLSTPCRISSNAPNGVPAGGPSVHPARAAAIVAVTIRSTAVRTIVRMFHPPDEPARDTTPR